MNFQFATCCLAIALGICGQSQAAPEGLAGNWALVVRDLNFKEAAVLTIRFADTKTRTCMSGEWMEVEVLSGTTSNADFFAVAGPWAYQLKGSELVIGRNGLCDHDLVLNGPFQGETVQGPYRASGLSGRRDLGTFLLKRKH